MAIEPLMMGSVLALSTVLPLGLARIGRIPAIGRIVASIGISVIAAEQLFGLLNPDYFYGPLYGLSMIMYFCISAAVATVVTILQSAKYSRKHAQ